MQDEILIDHFHRGVQPAGQRLQQTETAIKGHGGEGDLPGIGVGLTLTQVDEGLGGADGPRRNGVVRNTDQGGAEHPDARRHR